MPARQFHIKHTGGHKKTALLFAVLFLFKSEFFGQANKSYLNDYLIILLSNNINFCNKVHKQV